MENNPPRKQIFLIGDAEQAVFKDLQLHLSNAGFAVITVMGKGVTQEISKQDQPDLVILEMELQDENGRELFRNLGRETDLPALLLTAQVEETSRLIDGGIAVDDCLTKPSSPPKAAARVHAVFQHQASDQSAEEVISIGDLRIDLAGCSVARANQSIILSRTEFKILALLAKNPKRAFSRAQIIESLKGNLTNLGERTVDAHIKNLRNKLEPDPKKPAYIRTVFGFGYKFG